MSEWYAASNQDELRFSYEINELMYFEVDLRLSRPSQTKSSFVQFDLAYVTYSSGPKEIIPVLHTTFTI